MLILILRMGNMVANESNSSKHDDLEPIEFNGDLIAYKEFMKNKEFDKCSLLLKKYESNDRYFCKLLAEDLTEEFILVLWSNSELSQFVWKNNAYPIMDFVKLGMYLYETFKDTLDTKTNYDKTYREWIDHLLTYDINYIVRNNNKNDFPLRKYLEILVDMDLGNKITENCILFKHFSDELVTDALQPSIICYIDLETCQKLLIKYCIGGNAEIISHITKRADTNIDLFEEIYIWNTYPDRQYLIGRIYDAKNNNLDVLRVILDSGKVNFDESFNEKLADFVCDRNIELLEFFLEYLKQDTKHGINLLIACIDMVANYKYRCEYRQFDRPAGEYVTHVKTLETIISEKYVEEYKDLYNRELRYRGCNVSLPHVNNIYRLFYESVALQGSFIVVAET